MKGPPAPTTRTLAAGPCRGPRGDPVAGADGHHSAGFTARAWDELDLVQDWAAFLDDPARLLHHLLDD